MTTNNLLECPLCKEKIKSPHTLTQCLHSYCKTCLKAVPKTQHNDSSEGWFCPMCKSFTDSTDVQHNYFIEHLLVIDSEEQEDSVTKEQFCHQCDFDEASASSTCQDCKIDLCEECKVVHLRIPVLKDHCIVPLDSDKPKLVDRLVCCSKHDGKPIELNCSICELPICFVCKSTDHDVHKTETIEKALDRLLPELEKNTDGLTSNAHQIQAQIKALDAKMEVTRNIYSTCRVQMDDKIEKIIRELCARRAQLEDEIVNEEKIAMDRMNDIKEQLMNKLNRTQNLINVVETYTTKSRHSSLLNEVQSGIFLKVKEECESKPEHIIFEIPESVFHEAEVQKLEQNFNRIFGNLIFNGKSHTLNTSGSFWNDDEYMCNDFNELMVNSWKKELEIELEIKWCNRISFFNEKIWLPIGANQEVRAYDKKGEVEIIATQWKSLCVVKKSSNGDVIAGGISGLYVTDTEFKDWSLLTEGKFYDIACGGNIFATIEVSQAVVYVFQLAPNGWSLLSRFNLEFKEDINCFTTLAVCNDGFILIASAVNSKLYKFTNRGELVSAYTTEWLPQICGVDKTGKIIIANMCDGSLKTFRANDQGVFDDVEMGIAFPGHRHTIVDSDHSMWSLQNEEDDWKLVKYVTT